MRAEFQERFFLPRRAVLGEVRVQTRETFEHGPEKLRRPRFYPRPVCVRFVVDKMTLGLIFFSLGLRFFPVIAIPAFSILIFIYMFLLPIKD